MDRAIVIGGGVAALLAARVLRERFSQVTVLAPEPAQPALHGLLAGGRAALESLFPGLAERACVRGGRDLDVGEFARWNVEGVALPRMPTGLLGLLTSELRSLLRERLEGNIELRNERVVGLLGSAWKITGVQLEHGAVHGELVVDASGRSSAVPEMLRRFGLKPPSEDRVRVDLRATSCVVEARHAADSIVCTPCAPMPRGGVALALAERRFQVTLFGYLGAQANPSHRGMIAFARGIGDSSLYTLLRDAEPLSEPVQWRHPGSVRRRYERMRHRPRGLLAIGDALCSVNPAYGHGSSLAALQALALRRALESLPDERTVQQRFFSEATRIVDIPWSMVAGADLEFAGVRSTQPPPHPSIRAYFKRALRTAAKDRALALAVYRVMHLVDPPSALFAPALVTTVLGQREPPALPPRLKLVPDRS